MPVGTIVGWANGYEVWYGSRWCLAAGVAAGTAHVAGVACAVALFLGQLAAGVSCSTATAAAAAAGVAATTAKLTSRPITRIATC